MQDKVSINNNIEKHPGCVAGALSVVGDKWTALIIMQLSSGPSRFTTIENALKGISPRTLSQRLNSLEEKLIIIRENFAEVPPRVEYDLSTKGKDLIPIIKSMAKWGDKYYDPKQR